MEKILAEVLTRCRGGNRNEILKNAAKLSAKERLLLIKHFDIEPQKLASTLVFFWLHSNKGTNASDVSNPNLMSSD